MEIPEFVVHGNSGWHSRDSPTLSVMREMPNEHITKQATRTKIVKFCSAR